MIYINLRTYLIVVLATFISMTSNGQNDSIKILKRRGSEYYKSGDYDKSARSFKKIGELYNSRGDFEASFDYENKSLTSLKQHDIKLASEAGGKLFQKLENDSSYKISFNLWCIVSSNVASVFMRNGEHSEAVRIFQKISDTIQNSENSKRYWNFYFSSQFGIGLALEQEGRHLESIECLEALLLNVSSDTECEKLFQKLASLYKDIGNYDLSNNYLFSLIELEEEMSIEYAIDLNSIGNNYSKLGKPEIAIQFYLKSLDIRREFVEIGDPMLGVIYHNLGNMYKLIGKDGEAIISYNKALDNYKLAFGEPSERVGFVYNSLGNYYFDKLNFTEAVEHYKSGLMNRKMVLKNSNQYILHSYYNIANSFLQIGKIDSARYYIDSAKLYNPIKPREDYVSGNFKNLDYLKDYAFTYYLDGEILFQAYQHNNQIKLLENSTESFNESVKSYFQLLKIRDQENSKFAIVNDLRNSIIGSLKNQLVIDSLKGIKSVDVIYNLFEKSHNSQLFELLKQPNDDLIGSNESQNLMKILSYKRQLERISKSDTINYDSNTKMLSFLNNKIGSFNNRNHSISRIITNIDNTTTDIYFIKSLLNDKSLILQFLTSPDTNEVFFFCFSSIWENYGYFSTYKEFSDLTKKFTNSVRRFENLEANTCSIEISNLIGKVIPEDFNSYNRLIIIPDDFIWQIPFGAILNPKEQGRCIMQDFDVSIHLSCNLLTFNRVNQSIYDYDYIGFAPFSATKTNLIYGEIPSSKREILGAKQSLNRGGYHSYCLIDSAANLENFISFAPKGRVLHFATHFNNRSYSAKQGLLISPDFGTSFSEVIGYEEVLLVGAAPESVVLSACNSGISSIDIDGEGPINLNRAFIMNGTKNIVYSINKVDDKFSAEFFNIFYQALAKNFDFAACFQNTKRELMKNPSYSHPYYWSSLQIISAL